MRPLIVVGDVLLDRDLRGRCERVTPDAGVPVIEDVVEHARPGGAGLAALLAAREGREVVFVTALSDDAAAGELRDLLDAELELAALPWSGPTAQKVRVNAGDDPLLRIDLGGGTGRVGAVTGAARRAIATAGALLVADYGRGLTADPVLRALVAARAGRVPTVWDPHPRGAPPVPGVTLATPNLAEAELFTGRVQPGNRVDGSDPAALARALRRAWPVDAVAVTLGRHGALLDGGSMPNVTSPNAGFLFHSGDPLLIRPAAACDGDPCGAGDQFAAAVTGALCDGASLPDAVRHAVDAATRYVATGGPANLRPIYASRASRNDRGVS